MNLHKQTNSDSESQRFFEIHQQFLEKSTNIPLQASCEFYVITSRSEIQHPSIPCTYKFELCITGEWIFQRQINSKTIVSAFRCDYRKSFEVLRKNDKDLLHENLLSGLRIIFDPQRKAAIDFLITMENSNALLYFTKILQTKAIFQLGFFQNFKPIRRLGTGSTSIVYSVLQLSDHKTFAVKCSKKKVSHHSITKVQGDSFLNEISIWKQLEHPNIAKLHFVYASQNSIYMITDLLSTNLLNFIKRYGFPKREIAKKLIRQLLEAVSYLHDQGFMHRDIKLENIMITRDEKNKAEISSMLIDFGLAYNFENNGDLVRCGTPGYTAPEILRQKPQEGKLKYSNSCDIFSLGIVAYTLIFKKFPFQTQKIDQILKLNMECSITFPKDSNQLPDALQIDFLEKMLNPDPQLRTTAKQALKHPFLVSNGISSKSQQQIRNQKATLVQIAYNQ